MEESHVHEELETRLATNRSISLSGLEEPKPEQIWQLAQAAQRLPLLGEGYAMRVYPFPGDPKLVVKIPKTYSQTFRAMWKAGKLPIGPLRARRIRMGNLESYRWAQERGKGIFVLFRLYELPYRRLPYVIVQQRGEILVGQELRSLDLSQGSAGLAQAQEILTENLDLHWRALTQGVWERVDNFMVNNVYVLENGQRVQRIADAGEVTIVLPTPEERNRTQQWSVTRDLPAIHPDLVAWYVQHVTERFGRLSNEETAQLWNSQGPQAMDLEGANEAIRTFLSSHSRTGLEEVLLIDPLKIY